MGARGPKPQPTTLKLVRGETRPSRVNLNEPKAPAGPVEAPEYLDDDARAVWERLAPSLRARGLLTEWDVDMFAAFVTAVVHHQRAVRLVNQTAVLMKAAGHEHVVKHPALQIVRDQAAIMTAIGGRFGLTPSDRSSIAMPEGDDDAGASAILD